MRRTLASVLVIASLPALALSSVAPAFADPDPAAKASSMTPRPTDGDLDEQGDGYNTKQVKRKCSAFVCLHWVTKNGDPDKPPPGWADTTLGHLNRAWRKEVQQMGFRKPLSDDGRGGNGKLDFYLKDIGAKGQEAYCKEDRNRYLTSGYCVLDNDFLNPQLDVPTGQEESRLKVTAARELFHVIQFAYDADEDGWLKDSTARWMEERFADSVNDNRKYLLDGQLGVPHQSLDTYVEGGPDQYGNWAFWEYLTQRKGNGLVKQVWEKAAVRKGRPDLYSTKALKVVLKNKGGFKNNFAAYSSALTMPAKLWDEGSAWGASAPVTSSYTMQSTTDPATGEVGLSHMASRNIRFTTHSSLISGYRLKVAVDGPSSKTSPVAYLLVQKKDGSIVRKAIGLNTSGNGSATVGFDFASTTGVTLTLGNASTRFTCWKSGPTYSCSGTSKDDNKGFSYTGTLLAPTA